MLSLRHSTDPGWVEAVKRDFGAFLADHASCERKASATALGLVAHYPDRAELVRTMIGLAQEELEHFAQVVALLQARGLILRRDEKDPYVNALLKFTRRGSEAYFLDRLLLGGIVEARGCERFGLLAEALDDAEMRAFYREITRSEARHHGLFLRLSRRYFAAAEVQTRLSELLDAEAAIVASLPHRAALH